MFARASLDDIVTGTVDSDVTVHIITSYFVCRTMKTNIIHNNSLIDVDAVEIITVDLSLTRLTLKI